MTLFARTLLALLHFAPPSAQDGAPWADPSPLYSLYRYAQIADAIVHNCNSWRCASLLVAIAVGESACARDADEGPCHGRRCDANTSPSVWQVKAGWPDQSGELVTVERLFADRRLAAGRALRIARSSLRMCGDLSGLSGRCRTGRGPWTDRERLWRSVEAWTPPLQGGTSS